MGDGGGHVQAGKAQVGPVLAGEYLAAQEAYETAAAQAEELQAQADADEGKNTTRLSSDERDELTELRKKAKRLEVENEILKRAAAYFARENVLPK